MYSGVHWSKRKAEADRVHQLVKYSQATLQLAGGASIVVPVYRLEQFDLLVDIQVTAYFDKRPLDADNICSKLYIDALKGFVLINDTPKYLRSVTTRSVTDKENPRLEIEIKESNGW